MAVDFIISLDSNAVEALARRGGELDQNMENRARNVLQAAVAQAPVDTGRMRASGEVVPFAAIPAAWDVTFPVGYSLYVDQGYERARKRGGTTLVRGRPFLSGNVDRAIT